MKSTFAFLCVSFSFLGHLVAPLPLRNEAPRFTSFDQNIAGNGAFNLKEGIGRVPFSSGLGFPVQRNQPQVDVFAPQISKRLDLKSVGANKLNIAPIPVPGFPGPTETQSVPGVNTIPGLDAFNYLIGSLIPQAVAPANQLLGGSLGRILPPDQTQNLANRVFETLSAPAQGVEVSRMMGRWFQVINSPYLSREACTVAHYGALTNTSYSATFTILKFYREDNPHGSPRFSLGYGFKAGANGTFLIHSSNSPDSEPYSVVKVGPLNEFNQYDYAIVSNWIRFPVLVMARDPERFQREHMADVLAFLEQAGYINVMTRAMNLIAPVDYSQCQYTPTFSGAG